MDHRMLGCSGAVVSIYCLGTMTFGRVKYCHPYCKTKKGQWQQKKSAKKSS